MNWLRHYLLAVQFFTRIPVTGRLAQWVGYSPALLRASAAHFPGVGVLVGGIAAMVHGALLVLLAGREYAALLAAVLSTIATVLLTGAFHEDGLADVADGLGGSPERLRALEIMKDSRVGAFGALGLVLALLAKVSLLALLGAIGTALACAGLFAAHVVSRSFPLLLIRLLPYVGDAPASRSKPLADAISAASLLAASLWLALALGLASAVLSGAQIAAGMAAAALAFLWLWRLFHRRLQGFTGDCLGATQQVCELAFYLGLAVAASTST
jgi:adenosylcobinamide-GDP ribazoletransferase